MNRTIVWYRRDLRLADHAPLHRASARGAVIPVFVLDRALLNHPETATSRVAFMLDCLRALDQELRDRAGRLILRSGNPVEVLPQLVRETQADGIYAYTDCERIYGRVRDARLNQVLAEQQMKIRWFEPPGSLPDLVPYPAYRDRWFADMRQPLIVTPSRLEVPPELPSDPLPTVADLGLSPSPQPIPAGGTEAARQLLREFLATKVDRYYWQLSYPGAEATTGLSPYLKFGVISVRECYQTANRLKLADARVARSQQQFIARLRWGCGFTQRFRYLPQLEVRSLYSIFDAQGWKFDEALYQAWQTGQTGFPIIDAAARCLQATGGWKQLNFRVRAIYASFLSNLLGMDWRYGALHFMRHLIDGDCPIDHYQWAMQAGVTHCIDKSWTRIYNPEQVAVDRCDPDGRFIKQWVPELAHLPPEVLGTPAGLADYPTPILDYRATRQHRVQQLEQQRQAFRRVRPLIPHLARLPDSLVPFGSDRHPSDIQWAQEPIPGLFPTALDLDHLTAAEAETLRTWFVAHVDIPPHSSSRRRKRRSPKQDDSVIQLTLF
jgi:deoxyribodipyrimidine photo-lyase